MKIIYIAACKYVLSKYNFSDNEISMELRNSMCQDFIAGAEFANTWYSINENPPINTVLLCKVDDYYAICILKNGKWVNDSDLSIENVTHWRPIL